MKSCLSESGGMVSCSCLKFGVPKPVTHGAKIQPASKMKRYKFGMDEQDPIPQQHRIPECHTLGLNQL